MPNALTSSTPQPPDRGPQVPGPLAQITARVKSAIDRGAKSVCVVLPSPDGIRPVHKVLAKALRFTPDGWVTLTTWTHWRTPDLELRLIVRGAITHGSAFDYVLLVQKPDEIMKMGEACRFFDWVHTAVLTRLKSSQAEVELI